jgi:hypothetical protein
LWLVFFLDGIINLSGLVICSMRSLTHLSFTISNVHNNIQYKLNTRQMYIRRMDKCQLNVTYS